MGKLILLNLKDGASEEVSQKFKMDTIFCQMERSENMTKEEIIEVLKNAVRPNEEYCIDNEVMHALYQYSNPFDLVEPILEIIESNPNVDFGMPGDLVHFVEKFYKKGYEELLISSVKRHPTPHNIWMVHRCYNDIENPNHEKFVKLINGLKDDRSISDEIKKVIHRFSWNKLFFKLTGIPVG